MEQENALGLHGAQHARERTPALLDRYPCTWLTLQGYVYKNGSHPADVVSEMLAKPDCNPQLLWRVRATAVHFWENGDWREQRQPAP